MRGRLPARGLGAHAISRAAALVAVCALVVAAIEAPGVIGDLHRHADENALKTVAERELAGAHSIDISRDFLVEARRLIAPDESYRVEWGPNVRVSTPVTLLGLRAYTQHWLLPRREVQIEEADWLLCYGCPAELASEGEIAWSGGGGISIVRRA